MGLQPPPHIPWKAAAELSGPQAARMLPLVRDFYGEGCNNEALRILPPIGVRA